MRNIIIILLIIPIVSLGYDYSTGVPASIILSDPSKALIVFDQPVTTRIGNRYPTDIKGVEFEVIEISPLKTRIIGKFNKKWDSRPDRVFVYGIAPKNKVLKKIVKQVPVVAVVNQKVVKVVEKPKVVEKTAKNESEWWNFGLDKFSFSLFYTISYGSFYERIQNISAESTQNSPATLGASVNFNISKLLSYSGSTYWSMLNAAAPVSKETTINSSVADIPWEYGFTSYLEYSGFNFPFKPYFGFDLESFSTFNTDEIAVNQNTRVEARTHVFTYATVGVSYFSMAFDRPFLFKGSISKNFTSSSSRPSTQTDEDFNGEKFILFFATRIKGNWGASFLYKRHMMDGPTDMTISRYGLGVSYRFK